MTKTTKIATIDDNDKRFDKVVRKAFANLPLSLINKAIRKGDLKLNGKKTSAETKISTGDEISYFGAYHDSPADVPNHKIDFSDLDIIWQDNDLIALNKPQGVIVHSAKNSLEEKVRAYVGINNSLSFKVGPCHRLDRNTSGVIVFAKSAEGARKFAKASENNQLEKIYIALFGGIIKDKITWQDKIDYANGKAFASAMGKIAITHVMPIKTIDGNTLAYVKLETGRTHQIRVQASLHGSALVGDAKYGGKPSKEYYFLHAYSLTDSTGELFTTLKAPINRNTKGYFGEFN